MASSAAAQAQASQPQAAAPSPSAAVQKKPAPASQTTHGSLRKQDGTVGYATTNMLTFEDTRAIPRDGKLIADDGTVLSINGM